MGGAVSKAQFAREFQLRRRKYYRIAYSYVKNEHDALDIVGEAAYRGLKACMHCGLRNLSIPG